MTITTDQIPPGWHQGMSEQEAGESLLSLIRERSHMKFVISFLERDRERAVDWLVDMACLQPASSPMVETLLRLIPRINGELTQPQMNSLNLHPARSENPHVDGLIDGLSRKNNYRHPVESMLESLSGELAKKVAKYKKR